MCVCVCVRACVRACRPPIRSVSSSSSCVCGSVGAPTTVVGSTPAPYNNTSSPQACPFLLFECSDSHSGYTGLAGRGESPPGMVRWPTSRGLPPPPPSPSNNVRECVTRHCMFTAPCGTRTGRLYSACDPSAALGQIVCVCIPPLTAELRVRSSQFNESFVGYGRSRQVQRVTEGRGGTG